jgi:hypothetical protein
MLTVDHVDVGVRGPIKASIYACVGEWAMLRRLRYDSLGPMNARYEIR